MIFRIFAAVVAVVVSMTVPAHAATYLITYEGIVESGTDGRGLFGGGDLSNVRYTAVYTLNYPGPYLSDSAGTDESGVRSVYGSKEFDPTQAIPLAGILTINGISRSYGDMYGWLAYANNDGGGDQVQHLVESVDANGRASALYNTIWSYNRSFLESRDPTTTLVFEVLDGDGSDGSFVSYIDDEILGLVSTQLDLRPSRVLVAAAVPEPSTWAMMLLGFGAVGLWMRRAHKSSTLPQRT